MRDWAVRMGLIGLGGLGLVTAAINVDATGRGYRIADAEMEARVLQEQIAVRRDRCRRLLSTEKLAAFVERLGLTTEDLFPALPPELPEDLAWGRP